MFYVGDRCARLVFPTLPVLGSNPGIANEFLIENNFEKVLSSGLSQRPRDQSGADLEEKPLRDWNYTYIDNL